MRYVLTGRRGQDPVGGCCPLPWPVCPSSSPSLELMHVKAGSPPHPPGHPPAFSPGICAGATPPRRAQAQQPEGRRQARSQPLRRASGLPAPHAGCTPHFLGSRERGSSRLPPPSWGRGAQELLLALSPGNFAVSLNHFQLHKRLPEVSGGFSFRRHPSQRTPPCLLAGLVPGG